MVECLNPLRGQGLNEAKSKFALGVPKNHTVVCETAGDNVKITAGRAFGVPNAVGNAIGYALHRSRSHAVIDALLFGRLWYARQIVQSPMRCTVAVHIML